MSWISFRRSTGTFYESNIRKQLKIANLKDYENHLLTNLSGGEFKLIQVIREMMISPKFIIMDEPDVFLDFEHLNALKNLINSHKGTLLVITHNRYLLNHCFNKILHLENAELQEFDGTYVDYNFALLEMKIEQQELAAADMEEIERNRKIVERLRNEATKVDSATKGRSLKARVLCWSVSKRKTKSPFVDIKQPQIELHTSAKSSDDAGDVSGQTDADETTSEERTEQNHEKVILEVENYSVAFDRQIMEEVTSPWRLVRKWQLSDQTEPERQPFCVIFIKTIIQPLSLPQTLKLPIFPDAWGSFNERDGFEKL